MNIIEPSVELWKQGSGIQGMYDHIERCARICYRSENKGKVTSEQFVKALIKNRHFRCCEFGTVVLASPKNLYKKAIWWLRSVFNPWVKRDKKNHFYITNLRYIIEHYPKNWEEQIANMVDVDVNQYRPTIHWHVSRGIADEFRTHVMLSSLMESTRYVNYHRVGNDGMKNLNDKNNHMDFVIPSWYNPNNNDGILERAWVNVEERYSEMIEKGYKPQQAREVLSLSIATNLVQCGFRDAWDNFFNLRCDKAAHPDAIHIASKAIVMFNYLKDK